MIGRECVKDPALGMDVCFSQAFVSKDSGSKWDKLRSYVGQCIWGLSNDAFDELPVDAIFCSDYADKSGHQDYKPKSDLRLIYTETYFQKAETVISFEQQDTGVVGFGVSDVMFSFVWCLTLAFLGCGRQAKIGYRFGHVRLGGWSRLCKRPFSARIEYRRRRTRLGRIFLISQSYTVQEFRRPPYLGVWCEKSIGFPLKAVRAPPCQSFNFFGHSACFANALRTCLFHIESYRQ